MKYSKNFVDAYLNYRTWSGELIRAIAIRGYAGYHIRYLAIQKLLSPIIKQCDYILDVGCGVGDHLIKFAQRCPDKTFVGIDIDAELINNANRRVKYKGLKNLSFDIENCSEIDHEQTFDLIYSVDTLEHIEDVSDVVARLKRALRPNGYIAIHVPNREQKRHFSRMAHIEHEDHVRIGFSMEELEALFNKYNLQVLKRQYTHGYWGSLAWEFSYLFRQSPAKAISLMPLIQVLCFMDHFSHNHDGNGILILTQSQ